jgi:membrane protein YqaA with SNARE-associated domain
MMVDVSILAGLFLVALAAGSILPAQSEAALAALLLTSGHSPTLLIATATTGNVVGSLINWALGRGIERFSGRRWFPVGGKAVERTKKWYAKFGRWTLLLSWVPVIGDPLTVVAGVLKEPLWSFVPIVSVAKLARYLVVAAIALGWNN